MRVVGIMGAMHEEIHSIRGNMVDVVEEKYASRDFLSGKINGTNVALVFSGWGKTDAATTATLLLERYKVNEMIFLGVAGGISPLLNIGDVVISRILFQHDMNAFPLVPKHAIPRTGITFFKANDKLVERANLSAHQFFSCLPEKVSGTSLSKFGITSPKIVCGMIATGDEFIHTDERANAILSEHPETTVAEMEGASVAQVCEDFNVPFVVIRTVSDKANTNAKVDFPAFTSEIATHYSENILMGMI